METDQNNPYAKPNAPVVDPTPADEGFAEINLFSSKGRMGRLRYFYYSMVVSIIGLIFLSLLTGFLVVIKTDGGLSLGLILFFYFVWMVWFYLITIQRCHDFNMSGWLSSLLLLFPLSLVFYFIPGTKASNKYGLRPPSNSKAVIAGAIILPVIVAFFFLFVGYLESQQSKTRGIEEQDSLEQNEDAQADLKKLARYMKDQEK